MPKILLQEAHFMFLRALVDEFLEVGEDEDTPQDMLDLAAEVKVLLDHTKLFKVFSVEIDVEDQNVHH